MIGPFKQLFGKRPGPASRADLLSVRPIRNDKVEWNKVQVADRSLEVVLLRVPRLRSRSADLVARWFRLPEYRKIELDPIGSDVWCRCDGAMTVKAIAAAVADVHQLNKRQSEVSVSTYLRILAQRRLIGVQNGSKSSDKVVLRKGHK